jgi:hypothetical protein
MSGTESERDVAKPQVNPHFTWSEVGFKSPFAHRADRWVRGPIS